MDIKIGINNIPREVTIDAQATADEVEQALRTALDEGGLLKLSDQKGRKILVPASQIGYVDLGQEHSRPVGFGTV
ncbi:MULTISPECIES: DUF3107 domain-containing protein [unclassified Luteococcus]|uniref:DUF3107 domain-containing protein n=1 Tax=unclassified Luteococcus TaxID=2639923 RepID=UPI00313EFB4A